MSARSRTSIKDLISDSDISFPKEPNPCKKKSFVVETARDYASSTTAHGLPHIVAEGNSMAERIFWTIVVLLAVAFILYQTSNLYMNWQD